MEKQVKKQNNKKRRNILLATLIPAGAIVAATAITLPLVLRKGNSSDIELEYNAEFGYYAKDVQFKAGKTYKIAADVNIEDWSIEAVVFYETITEESPTVVKGEFFEAPTATLDGVSLTLEQEDDSASWEIKPEFQKGKFEMTIKCKKDVKVPYIMVTGN